MLSKTDSVSKNSANKAHVKKTYNVEHFVAILSID
jgi:hypothetical protein